ncbi:hypothetical protein SUGI_0552350 [Cryptomeria japonica]|nr:hypothetical protein SUGI_0552350 [Cryptomeria japonica]
MIAEMGNVRRWTMQRGNDYRNLNRRISKCRTSSKKAAKGAPVCEKAQQHLKQVEGYEEEEDGDGVICSVCGGHDSVFVMVRASCYGDPLFKAIPDGD